MLTLQLCDSLGEGLLNVCKPMVNALVDHMSAKIGVMIILHDEFMYFPCLRVIDVCFISQLLWV